MIIRCFLYISLTFFISCSFLKKNKVNKDSNVVIEKEIVDYLDKKPLVKMRKTPCFGRCPYFEVSIYDDGLVVYDGMKFVEKIGKYSSFINKKKVALIEDYIRRADFFSFEKEYDARVTDLPSVIIEVNYQNKNHKVKGRYRIPEKFKMFTKFIDNLLLEIDSWDKAKN